MGNTKIGFSSLKYRVKQAKLNQDVFVKEFALWLDNPGPQVQGQGYQ